MHTYVTHAYIHTYILTHTHTKIHTFTGFTYIQVRKCLEVSTILPTSVT